MAHSAAVNGRGPALTPGGRAAGLFTKERLFFPALTIFVAVMVLSPLVMLLYGSLTSAPLGTWDSALSLANYQRFLTSDRYLGAFWNTIHVAIMTTVLGGGLGLLMAWLVVRTDVPMARGLRFGLMVPFFLSPLIGTLAWVTLTGKGAGPDNRLLDAVGLPMINLHGPGGIILMMALYYAPYMFIFVSAALENMDASLEEAGSMCGLTRAQVMRRITLPLMAPAVLSGLVLTFVSAAGQFGVPALLGTPVNYLVMTTYIFDLTLTFPTLFNLDAAMAVVLLLLSGGLLWAQPVPIEILLRTQVDLEEGGVRVLDES